MTTPSAIASGASAPLLHGATPVQPGASEAAAEGPAPLSGVPGGVPSCHRTLPCWGVGYGRRRGKDAASLATRKADVMPKQEIHDEIWQAHVDKDGEMFDLDKRLPHALWLAELMEKIGSLATGVIEATPRSSRTNEAIKADLIGIAAHAARWIEHWTPPR